MSVSIFNAVPAGVIEVLSRRKRCTSLQTCRSWSIFRACQCQSDIQRHQYSLAKVTLKGGNFAAPYSQRQNDHDAFVDLEGALEIVVRSRKPKAVKLVPMVNS